MPCVCGVRMPDYSPTSVYRYRCIKYIGIKGRNDRSEIRWHCWIGS